MVAAPSAGSSPPAVSADPSRRDRNRGNDWDSRETPENAACNFHLQMTDAPTADQARADQAARPSARAGTVADGFGELDGNGALLALDVRFLEIFGLSGEESDELIGIRDVHERQRTVLAALTARTADPTTYVAGAQRQLAMPDEITFEDIPLRDGRIVERYGTPIRASNGSVVGRSIVVRDVTARRRADVELGERARQQEVVAALGELALNCEDLDPLFRTAVRLVAGTLDESYVHLLELSPDGALLATRCESGSGGGPPASPLDANGRSPAALALADGTAFVASDVPHDPRCLGFPTTGALSAASAVVRSRLQAFGVLCVHWPRAGAPAPHAVHFVQTVANVLAAASARYEAERALAERQRELRAVFDATQEALLTTDDGGRLTSANEAARRLFARPLPELMGRQIFSLCGCDRDRTGQDRWAELQATGHAWGTVEVHLAGAASRTAEWHAVARILPGRHLFALRDVTEERTMQARLALTDRMASLGTLAAGIAHELNTPLAYVSANIGFASRELEDAGRSPAPDAREEARAALKDAIDGADRMRRIIRDLRMFARPDDARDEPVRLQPILESAVNLAWNEIKHRARLVRDLVPVPSVRGNEARLGQVFLNLIVNAAQAIPPGAADRNEISVRTRLEPDGRVAVEVRDSGSGILPEHLPRIFDPFFTTKPVGEGTGLGLSICHRIVSDMRGSIEVDSEPGRGTTFVVRLVPAGQDRAPAEPAGAASEPGR